ncbi:DUF1284 domain-containing protein [Chloroflexota bacterium]
MLELRAHHICCAPFVTRTSKTPKKRGSEFYQLHREAMTALTSQPDTEVRVIEGGDALCLACVHYSDGACMNVALGEVEIRKWDAEVLRDVDILLGTCLTAGEWQALIKQKTPYQRCQICILNKRNKNPDAICSIAQAMVD